MSYVVLARRFRPQTFDQLIGQEGVARTLRNAIDSGRIAHAYLFCGPRGTGKTSAARILAKCLNCENGPTAVPCNECDICSRISAGDDLDVVEMDAASNTSVNYIRELRENAQYATGRARFKVYIIDEVHMLSTAAFNALLKTLEEPPAHVKFIFATTEPQRLPETVRSRCQRFDFRQLAADEIRQALAGVCDREGVKYTDEALYAVARHARGGMRDALSVLDQLISYAGGQEGKLTADLVRELTGAIEEERLLEVLEQTAAGQTAPAIESLASIIDAGIDPGELGDALIERVRELTLLATCGDKADLIIYTGELQKRAAALSEQMGIDRLLYTLRLLSDARREAQSATHARVPLELAILRLSRTGDLADLGELAGNVAALVKSGLPPAAEPSGNPKSGADAPNTEASRSRPLHRTAPAPAAVPTPAPAQPSPAATNAPAEPTLARVKEVWPQALQKLNPRHRGRVQEAVVTGLEGRQVMLRLPSSKAFTVGHLRKVGAPQQLAAALSEVLGVDVEVDFDSSADLEPADEPSPPPNNEPQLPDGEEIRRRAREAGRAADPEEHPTVQAALSKLKGRIRAKERGLGPEGRS